MDRRRFMALAAAAPLATAVPNAVAASRYRASRKKGVGVVAKDDGKWRTVEERLDCRWSVGDWEARSVAQNRHQPEQVLKFMDKLLPRLERCSYLERYAWFPAEAASAVLGTSALFDQTATSRRSASSISRSEDRRAPTF